MKSSNARQTLSDRLVTGPHLQEDTALALADGTLALAERAGAMAHLDACARCRQWVMVLGGEATLNFLEPTVVKPAPGPPGELTIGQLLGEYEVLERLAQGGMGAVYRGRQPVIGKNVAIKVLLPHVAADPGLVDRLLIEAQAVNAIRHPNIIDVFSFGQTESGQHYFVMEFLEGELLSARLRREGKLTVRDSLMVLEQMCSGLGAVHSAGVLHRDLKPGNIFLTPLTDGTTLVKLLDFGLAKRPSTGPQQSRASVMMGTAGYMAPEQIRAEVMTPKTDLYALGVVAYRMITGQQLFEAESDLDLLKRHLTEPAPLMSTVMKDLPPGLVTLVAALLERDPAARPSGAHDVRREVQRLQRSLESAKTMVELGAVDPAPTSIDVITAPEGRPKVLREQRRARMNMAIALVAGACVGAGTFGVVYFLNPPNPRVVPPPIAPPSPPAPVAPPVREPPPPVAADAPVEPAAEKEKDTANNPVKPTVGGGGSHQRRPSPPVTAEAARAKLKDARARTARLNAQGMRRIVESELTRLEKGLEGGDPPAKVVAEVQQVLKDYSVP